MSMRVELGGRISDLHAVGRDDGAMRAHLWVSPAEDP